MQEAVYVARLGRSSFESVQQLQRAYTEQLRRGLRHSLVVLVEHEAVYTYGQRRGAQREAAAEHSQGVGVVAAARGGDVTFHGPGQLVAYPLLDLKALRRADLRRYVGDLEETLIRTCRALGLPHATRHPQHTGVWIGPAPDHLRKIGFVGIHASSWVTSQGVSLNRTADPIPYFRAIVPCGIHGCPVTSLQQELLLTPPSDPHPHPHPHPPWADHIVQEAFIAAFQSVFSVQTRDLHTPLLLHADAHDVHAQDQDPTIRRVPIDRSDAAV